MSFLNLVLFYNIKKNNQCDTHTAPKVAISTVPKGIVLEALKVFVFFSNPLKPFQNRNQNSIFFLIAIEKCNAKIALETSLFERLKTVFNYNFRCSLIDTRVTNFFGMLVGKLCLEKERDGIQTFIVGMSKVYSI